MNAMPRQIVAVLGDRARELAALTALTTATWALTWWFAIPTTLAAAWWTATEIRLWRASRAAATPPTPNGLATAAVTSEVAVTPAEPVSAGQQDKGRAGA